MRRLVLLALLVPFRFLAAQAPSADSGCDSLLVGADPIIDSLQVSVEMDARVPRIDRSALQSFAITVGTLLQLPHPLAVPSVFYVREVRLEGKKKKSQRYAQGLRGEVMMVLDSSGAPGGVVLAQSMLEPMLDSALIAAVRQTVTYGIPQPMVDAARNNRGAVLFVGLETRTGAEKATTVDRDGRKASVGIAALRVPTIEMTRGPRLKKMERPSYPAAAQASGIEGDALIGFVIRPDGFVEPGTVALYHASASEFALASLRAVAKAEYSPALSGSCPVAVLVQQPFKFLMEQRFPMP